MHRIYHGKEIVNIATVSPKEVFVGNPEKNVDYMKKLVRDIFSTESPGIVVFPELCITGYTCGDLFNQTKLIKEAKGALYDFVRFTGTPGTYYSCLFVVGCPLRMDNQLFNCAVAIQAGNILGIVPKTYIPNYNEFYESRYFASADEAMSRLYIIDRKRGANKSETVEFSPYIHFTDEEGEEGVSVGIEICEDAWVPLPPSRLHCAHGANIIINLSASNETIGKEDYRRQMIKMHSATCNCVYAYCSASIGESTSDTVFSGHQIIAENGRIINESRALSGKEVTMARVDIEKCMNDRYRMNSYRLADTVADDLKYEVINDLRFMPCEQNPVGILPFVPPDMEKRMKEIIRIQATGLAQRIKKIGCWKAVIGISGGLDSTLALIVVAEAFHMNKLGRKGIIGITMPAYGTSERTLNNSRKLMDAFGITSYEIDITKACDQHYTDIGHDKALLDVTFENVQARERTQVLMDMANKHSAIVIGTGDMSELALGWCTYNGDHMSMYGVNSSIPKTLVRHLVSEYGKEREKGGLPENKKIAAVLKDICDTPISPELLPPNADGTISQSTEDTIGSYVTHDFVLYYMLRYGFSPEKIFWLYVRSLESKGMLGKDSMKKIKKDMTTFYRRFQNNQFKRNCIPDGIKVGSIALSPRADWRMPSDADMSAWIKEIQGIEID